MSDLHCPVCGAELDLSTVFSAHVDQQVLERMINAGFPIGSYLLRYISLHKPPKQVLTIRKKLKLINELLPDVERQAVSRNGRDWAAPKANWALAIDQMVASAQAGRLDLPLKGHGYLHTLLQSMADKAEAALERQAEQDKRTSRAHLPTVTVRGQATHASNPVLQAMDQQNAKATPMPANARALLSRLQGGAKPQSTAGDTP